jgi:5-methylcytosine-specific restriction endonuclease McrA
MKSKLRKKHKKALNMNRCKICHSTENLTVDHIVPLIKGGADKLENLQCLCRKCNGYKSDMTNKHFKKILKYGMEVFNKRGKTMRYRIKVNIINK